MYKDYIVAALKRKDVADMALMDSLSVLFLKDQSGRYMYL